jgi:hypothetical protein
MLSNFSLQTKGLSGEKSDSPFSRNTSNICCVYDIIDHSRDNRDPLVFDI